MKERIRVSQYEQFRALLTKKLLLLSRDREMAVSLGSSLVLVFLIVILSLSLDRTDEIQSHKMVSINFETFLSPNLLIPIPQWISDLFFGQRSVTVRVPVSGPPSILSALKQGRSSTSLTNAEQRAVLVVSSLERTIKESCGRVTCAVEFLPVGNLSDLSLCLYGGSCLGRPDVGPVGNSVCLGAIGFCDSWEEGSHVLQVMFNASMKGARSVWLSVVQMSVAPDIKVRDFPIVHQSLESRREIAHQFLSIAPMALAFGLSVSIQFISASIVREREFKQRFHVELTGVSPFVYWAHHAVCDIGVYAVLAVIWTIALASGRAPLLRENSCVVFFVILILYGILFVLFAYLLSLLFPTVQSVKRLANMVVLLSSLIPGVFSFLFNFDSPGLVRAIFLMSPTASFFVINERMVLAWVRHSPITLWAMLTQWGDSAVGEVGTVRMTVLAVIAQIFSLVAVISVWEWIRIYLSRRQHVKSQQSGPDPERVVTVRGCDLRDDGVDAFAEVEDVLVSKERLRVLGLVADGERRTDAWEENALMVNSLVKTFDAPGSVFVHALDNVSFGVVVGECFCVLGPNGSGKTTLLNILSNQLPATSGSCFVSEGDGVGLCPQTDGHLFGELTVVEHIRLFLRLRGFSEVAVPRAVQKCLEDFRLESEATKRISLLSGGNKRKVSVALAFGGTHKTVLLDEPSRGLDSASRNALLRAIRSRGADRAVLLTTHSLEEAELVSSRIGVLSHGRLVALGTTGQLRDKSGRGITFEIALNGKDSSVEAFLAELRLISPSFHVIRMTADHVSLAFPLEVGGSIADVYEVVHPFCIAQNVSSYSLCLPTLEQVFLSIVQQSDESLPGDATATVHLGKKIN